VVILLLSVTIGVFWHKNSALHVEKEAATERARSEAEADIAKERKLRLITEKQLDKEQKRRQKSEHDLRKVRAIIEKIRRFEPLADQKGGSYEEPKYYDVTNVEIDDVLNVREFPGYLNKKVAEIPPTEKCLKFLGNYRLFKSQVWAKIQYNDVPGWVNSAYLTESTHCNGEKDIE